MNIRKDLKKRKKYVPVKSAEDIAKKFGIPIGKIDKLDAGESAYDMSPLAVRKMSQFNGYRFYPDPKYLSLKKELSRYTGVDINMIFVSNGGDEIIDLLLRLVLEVGEEVIDCPPTFSSYSLFTSLNRGLVKNVMRKKDYSIDCEAIMNSITPKTKIIFICNPNNPTGNIIPLCEIETLLKTGVLVCVDEAYIEFGGVSAVPLLMRYPNLIIIRTFSKWAGMAGLRLGYGLMSRYLVSELMNLKAPYNVNYAAVIAGIASLKDVRYRQKTTRATLRARKDMQEEIKRIPSFRAYPSNGNFIFVRTSNTILKKIKEECNSSGIALRFYEEETTGYAMRITIGRPLQNKKVIRILKKNS